MSADDSVYQAARECFDISWTIARAQEAIQSIEYEMQRPSVLFRPQISVDGNKWCALYGGNLQDGVAGFGNSASEAMEDFDINWRQKLKVSKCST